MVPTSTRRAPDCAITSGTRKPPPISTLSPRDDQRPRGRGPARPATSSTAAALLFTTMAASAPHSRASRRPTCAWREPRRPVARSSSRLRVAGLRVDAERGPAEVGVQQHARGVDDPPEQRPADGLGSSSGRVGVAGGDGLPGRVDQQRVRAGRCRPATGPGRRPTGAARGRSSQAPDQQRRRIGRHYARRWCGCWCSLIIVPLVELAVFIQVASAIGVWNAIGLLILVSLVGAWIVKRQGTAMWRRAQLQVTAGRVPTKEMADGVLLLLAGVLLLVPGFVTVGGRRAAAAAAGAGACPGRAREALVRPGHGDPLHLPWPDRHHGHRSDPPRPRHRLDRAARAGCALSTATPGSPSPGVLVPRDAATVMLLRDSDAGPEVFMLRRTLNAVVRRRASTCSRAAPSTPPTGLRRWRSAASASPTPTPARSSAARRWPGVLGGGRAGVLRGGRRAAGRRARRHARRLRRTRDGGALRGPSQGGARRRAGA